MPKLALGMAKQDVLQCFVASLILACLLLLLLTPIVLASPHKPSLVGPKQYYLALGDSLAFGYQPDFVFNHGYVDDFYKELRGRGVSHLANLGCPDETSSTFINGGCSASFLRKFPYLGSQLAAALTYLNTHPGQVSPVTLNIGSNDVLSAINVKNCSVDKAQFETNLATLDNNLTQTILPQLHDALTVNHKVTGDIVMMSYYDPFQNVCPNTVSYVQELNQHLAKDVLHYGLLVNVFKAFGGFTTPNTTLCTNTWMCTVFQNIHASNTGYDVIAKAFEDSLGY